MKEITSQFLKIRVQYFILLFFLLVQIECNLYSQTSGAITFIGNEGFMIESNGKKVLIDALYNSSLSGVQNTEATLRERMMNALPPFENSQLYLLSHSHDDHFSKDMVTNYLLNNTQSKLIAPLGIIETVTKAEFANQLVAENPDKFQFIDTLLNGISITTYNLVHKLKINIYNVGYFIDIDGFKVFHAGDNVMDDTTEYVNYNIARKQPDVALLNYTSFWQTEARRSFVMKYIKPRFIIVMHIPVNKFAEVEQQVSVLDNLFPPVIVFQGSMEKVQVGDSLEIINHMPVIDKPMDKITIEEGSTLPIKLPNVYSDIDEGDSLTYSISNKPLGLFFDSINSTINCSALAKGSYILTLVATDKSFSTNKVSITIQVDEKGTAVVKPGKDIFCIYPNPCKDWCTITSGVHSTISAKLFDLRGVVLSRFSISERLTRLDVKTLQSGNYFVEAGGEFMVLLRNEKII